jgi:outer membrane protein assembly factor BamB
MPAADDTDVAFTYGAQHLVLLDAHGVVRWDVARLGLRDVAPRLTADLVVAATDDGVAAFRRIDGAKVWDTPLQARANTPVVAANVAVTSTWEGDLLGLDLGTGRVAWKVALGGSAIGPPATDGATAVVTWQEEHGLAGGAVAVDVASGRRRWAVALPPGGIAAPAVTPDGTVVVVAGDIAAHGLALATGQERWRTPLEGAGSPEVPPALVGTGMVLTAHRLGGLDLLDTRTGTRSWQLRTDGAAVRGGPVVGPSGSFAFPLDDGRMVMAGPNRETEFRPAPSRISGLVTGPGGLLVAATRGGLVNSIQATPVW